ncbi:MAG TPA: hypothetical protein VNI20_07640, partial [Fimbriimonadaceae bacterium]|nr:hypothetical protein [Fimbriimonadaceae bacterium]
MFVALLLLLQAGSSPGWPVSSRVVDELLPLLNDSQGDIGRVAGELVDSGNEGLAYRVLNAYGKRWKDSRFLLFRRAGRIDDLIRLVDGYYPDNSKYPELIRDALDYPSRGNTDRALAFLDSEIRAGRDGGLGMKDVDKDLDRQELFFKFCSLLRDQSHWDEMFYAADRTLDKKWLGFLLRTFPRMYGGDVPGPYDDSLRPIFSGSIDRLITKHPDMFEDEDLIRFAGLLGSPAMVRTAVDRLLNKAA